MPIFDGDERQCQHHRKEPVQSTAQALGISLDQLTDKTVATSEPVPVRTKRARPNPEVRRKMKADREKQEMEQRKANVQAAAAQARGSEDSAPEPEETELQQARRLNKMRRDDRASTQR